MPSDSTADAGDYDDMIEMDELTEDTILTNLTKRFNRDIIYTNIQNIVISVLYILTYGFVSFTNLIFFWYFRLILIKICHLFHRLKLFLRIIFLQNLYALIHIYFQ